MILPQTFLLQSLAVQDVSVLLERAVSPSPGTERFNHIPTCTKTRCAKSGLEELESPRIDPTKALEWRQLARPPRLLRLCPISPLPDRAPVL